MSYMGFEGSVPAPSFQMWMSAAQWRMSVRMVIVSTNKEPSSVSVLLALRSVQMEPSVLITGRKNATRHMTGVSF